MDVTTITAVLGAFGWGAYVPLALAAIGLVAHLVAVLPPARASSPGWWRVGRRLLDLTAGNYGSAANAISPAVPVAARAGS